MKKIIFLSALFFCINGAFSQTTISVTETITDLAGSSKQALQVEIFELESSEVEKLWKKALKDKDAKVSSSKGEYFADNAIFKSIGNNPVDVYSKIEKKEKSVVLMAGFDLGGAFLTSVNHPEEYKILKQFLYGFGVSATKEGFDNIIHLQEKDLKKLDKDLEDLQKENKALHNSIEDYKEKIKKAESDIVENDKNQQSKATEIEVQKKLIETSQKNLKEVR